METLRPFTFNEKLAIALLILFFPVDLVVTVSLHPGHLVTGREFASNMLWVAAALVIGFVALCVSVAAIFLRPAHHPSRLRMQLGRLLPLTALIVGIALNSINFDAFANAEMRKFARLHRADLAGPPPRAVIYREGIPDGGIAIVRSPGANPTGFSQRVMVELTGERIKSCRPLSASDWSCHFD